MSLWGRTLKFLVDSGSDVTILPYGRYLEIPPQLRPPLTPMAIPVYGAGGHPLDVRGTCKVSLGIGTEVFRVDCTVIEGGICPILGMNFIKEHDVSIHFGSGAMQIGKSQYVW